MLCRQRYALPYPYPSPAHVSSLQDTTPMSRVISRFSKDMTTVDTSVGRLIAVTVAMCLNMGRVIVTMAISTKGLALLLLFPVMFVYRFTAVYARNATVLLQRMEAVSKAPVFAGFTETLHGISTIRAFKREAARTESNSKFLDLNTRPFYLQQAALLWMGLRLDVLGGVVSTVVFYPFECFEAVAQIDGAFAKRSIPGGIQALYNQGGVPALFCGWFPTAVGCGVNWAVYFVLIQLFGGFLDSVLGVGVLAKMVAGILAGSCAPRVPGVTY